jgi:2-dehydro-3-deoxy-D-arabinonate dehydratase
MIAVSRNERGLVVQVAGAPALVRDVRSSSTLIDELFVAEDPVALAQSWHGAGEPIDALAAPAASFAPMGSQEVWACGVTYLRSRDARMEESESAGGDVFYDMVYDADRPEIFFKATPHRVVGDGGAVRIRRDSTWDVPEPEFTLAVSATGKIIGYTIGNDMSSRSIEGENPLYLPQAKVYDGCAALGPRLVLGELPPSETRIGLEIRRADDVVFTGETALDQIKRGFDELVEHLFRDNSFPAGVFVMTGTGIVPGDGFTLAPNDEVAITIEPVGTLTNRVVRS